MKKQKHQLEMRLIKGCSVLLATVPFLICWFGYYEQRMYVPFYAKGHLLVIALFMTLFTALARTYDAFKISVSRISDIVYSQALAALVTDCLMFVIIWLLTRHFPALWPGLLALLAQLLLATVWAVAAHKWYYFVFPPRRSALVYGLRRGIDALVREYGMEKKFDIQKICPAEECMENMAVLEGMETVFISGVQSHDRNQILKYCMDQDIPVYVVPRIGDVILSGAERVHMFHLPMLHIRRQRIHPEHALLKRLFDIALSLTALIVFSPVMLASAIAIKLQDGGPVFYKQTRLTKDGATFQVMKFRSMRMDAEKDGVARLSTGDNDDRITPVGRLIRKVRIDELPQLLNILDGSMSVVGPRPERPEIAAQYEQELPEFRLRLQVKAGLTGYAQVYGKYNTTPYDKLQMDLMYIANPSIIEDLKIILATVKILFVPESTEGIAEGQTTAATAQEEKELVGAGK